MTAGKNQIDEYRWEIAPVSNVCPIFQMWCTIAVMRSPAMMFSMMDEDGVGVLVVVEENNKKNEECKNFGKLEERASSQRRVTQNEAFGTAT